MTRTRHQEPAPRRSDRWRAVAERIARVPPTRGAAPWQRQDRRARRAAAMPPARGGATRPVGVALLLGAVLLAGAGQAWCAKVGVRDELERLAAVHGFSLVGVQATEDAVGRADREDLYPRLRRLLEDFDHVIVQSPDGGVQRVIILGEKVPFVPPPVADGEASDAVQDDAAGEDIVLRTERRGNQHAVTVTLEGDSRRRLSQTLLVDTGADYVVLPSSLAASLGVSLESLREQEMQTANGRASSRVGRLAAIWLGRQRLAGVEVAFIDDDKLGESGLLGMSALGRYTMTIDDEAGNLTLSRTGGGAPEADGEEAAPAEGESAGE